MSQQLKTILLLLFSLFLPAWTEAGELVDTAAKLVEAVANAPDGTTIELAPGTYKLSAPLEPKAGMTIKGAGIGKTILTNDPAWQPSTSTLPDPEVRLEGLDSKAYLIRLPDKSTGITIFDMTLLGPQMHGAIFGFQNQEIELHHLRIEDTLWAGIRTLSMTKSKIHDCEFVDAGGRWQRGKPGTDGGITGGAIWVTWISDSEIYHNRFVRTQEGKADSFFGIKGRQAKRCRIHHNTINVNFSIELPFEGDEDVEIDHNICHGVISIPKYAGGKVPESGKTFDIHHNYFTTSYAIEFVRNGVSIHHNLFDFDVNQDGGNLISAFGKAPAAGPAEFHNNLVSNPGRGVIWINEPYDNLVVRNNHIIARTTSTPREDGLFGFNSEADFSMIKIVDNVIECQEKSRPLLRNEASYKAEIRNNVLTNLSDTDRYANPEGDASPGLEEPLKFTCGVHDEQTVDGWKIRATAD